MTECPLNPPQILLTLFLLCINPRFPDLGLVFNSFKKRILEEKKMDHNIPPGHGQPSSPSQPAGS